MNKYFGAHVSKFSPQNKADRTVYTTHDGRIYFTAQLCVVWAQRERERKISKTRSSPQALDFVYFDLVCSYLKKLFLVFFPPVFGIFLANALLEMVVSQFRGKLFFLFSVGWNAFDRIMWFWNGMVSHGINGKRKSIT